jgi:spermidine synthase
MTARKTKAPAAAVEAPAASSAAPAANSQRHLPWLTLLFVGSGAAALIYEIVWFQMLSLIIGSSAVSMGVLLGTFMGGMGVGSLLLARFVPARQHPLRVYALLEAGIGVFGIVSLLALPWVGGLYGAVGGSGIGGLLFRGLLCALLLLPPTLLMGATLPAIARWVEATPKGVSWMGFFYGGNIAGAVCGSLLAGFYLLREHDVVFATFTAVVINALVAAIGFGIARTTPHHPPAAEAAAGGSVRFPRGSWPVLVTIGLSGMTALAAEAVWTRLLTLLLGGTVYTFSLILAGFLAGLGIGSSVGSWLARSIPNPRFALGLCQMLLVAGIAWGAYSLTQALPYWPVNPWLSASITYNFQIDFARTLWVVIPAALLWGASFPLALAAIAERQQDPGRLVGAVYAANTAGAILGALAGSLLLIAWIGTQQAQRVLIALVALSALLMLVPAVTQDGRFRLTGKGLAWGALTAALALWLGSSVAPVPGLLVAYGRYMAARQDNHGDIIYVGEGINSSMAVSLLSNGVLNYHNAGKVQASSEPQDMRLQRMLGHLTTLVPEKPGNVLVIGCGAGVTAGAVSIDPMVERMTIAEIEPLVPEVVSEYFGAHNFNVVRNPRVNIHIDDARHFLVTTDETFDAITSDPFDPWVKGAATLYTREFFTLAKAHLNPGGVMTVFVQLYESSMDAVKSEIATFMEVFPDGIVFGNTNNGQGYDLVLLGQKDPGPIDLERIEARLVRSDYEPIVQSLGEIGFYSVEDLFATYAGRGPELGDWLRDAQINRDRNLRLQYLAGLGLNLYNEGVIYSDMLQHRRWPEGLFDGTPEHLNALQATLGWLPR